MEKTTKDHLVDALDDLSCEKLRRFKNKLCDRKVEPRVRRTAVERAQYTTDLADLLTNHFTTSNAVEVAVEVLKAVGCNQVAEDLEQATGGNCPAPQPQAQDKTAPRPQVSGGTPGPPSRGYDLPDTSSLLTSSKPEFKQDIMREKGQEMYTVLDRNGRQRLALLINNVEFDNQIKRNGAKKDEENMEKLLRGLGYEVVKHTNLSGQEMDEAIKSFAARPEHAKSDSTFIVIMSHGKRDAILGVHHRPDNTQDFLPVDNIYKHLNTANCPALRDKPKVILIQACRGGQNGSVWVDMESDAYEHQEKDFLSLMSCTPDTVSYRHPQNGSLFIGFLVQVFNANAHRDHVEELCRQVMRCFDSLDSVKFGHRKQMVCKERTSVPKLFYLFPGL